MGAGYESKEYERLVARGFRDYSLGHRRMYGKAIEAIAERGASRVLEVGFGIGYGLKEMGLAGILESYVGYEPNFDSFNWTKTQAASWLGLPWPKVLFLNLAFEPNLAGQTFDDVFCIEVIEHVPKDEHAAFLRAMGTMLAPGGTLWLSTPDKIKQPKEGVRTTGEWGEMVHAAGFERLSIDTSEWTHLYVCSDFRP